MASRSRGKLSSELIEQKLVLFNSSQESVQAMSLWIMHNKSHHQKIVDTWIKVLRKSDSKHKLTLFYLCNDVVQHAKKKKALYYLENFKDNLREAVQIVREFDSIKPNIERIFKIWEDRRTYDVKFVKELRGIMEGESSSKTSSASGTPALDSPIIVYKPSSKADRDKHRKEEKKANTDSDKIIAKPVEEMPEITGEFKTTTFVDQMTSLKKLEGDVTLKAKQLAALRIDATNIEAVKQLKDRSHGNEFCRQFEESCVKIEDYVAMLEKEIRQRQVVLAMCDNAEEFYCTQFDEAKVVANAYKNFGARVTNMKKRVDDMKKIIPSTPSPMPSPTVDAPSPGNTPPLQDLDDNETIDMDLDMEDGDQSKHDPVPKMPGRAYTAMVKSVGHPIASLTNIVMRQTDQTAKAAATKCTEVHSGSMFQGTNVLESRIATMLPDLAKGNSAIAGVPPPGLGSQPTDMFTQKNNLVSQVADAIVPDVYTPPPRREQPAPQPVQPVQSIQPVQLEPDADEAGSSTPVQDEQEDKEPTPPPRTPPPRTPPPRTPPQPKPSETKTKTNPIDFLSQLLTKTSSSSSSSNFLQTLSLLTNTVKTQYQKKQTEDVEGAKPRVDPKPASPTFSVGMTGSTQSTPVEFTGVPPPIPSTQSSSWSGWKQINAAQPDPSSPPVISQSKASDLPHQPPLPQQHPPPPPEPIPPRPYGLQPPSPQDFSLPPPPSMRQNVSQSFINPPPPVPPPSLSSQQFITQVSSSSFTQAFSSQPVVLSASDAPKNLAPPQIGIQFNPSVPFRHAVPPVSNASPALLRPQAPRQQPPLPQSQPHGFIQVREPPPPQPPPSSFLQRRVPPQPQPQPPSGFISGRDPPPPQPPSSGFIQGRDPPPQPPSGFIPGRDPPPPQPPGGFIPARDPPPPSSGFIPGRDPPPQPPGGFIQGRDPPPPQPPSSGFIPGRDPPPPQAASGFMQGQENAWLTPRPPIVTQQVRPNIQVQVQPSIQGPFIRGPFSGPPPPPPNTAAPPQWQPERDGTQNQPSVGFNNKISSVPTQRSDWDDQTNSSYDERNWEPDMGGSDDQSGGYAHPWDQPQNYDEDDDETDFVDEILETTLPPTPKKSILRNSRTSSLREVTLVEEDSALDNVAAPAPPTPTNKNLTPVIPQIRDHKPIGILKKMRTDVNPVSIPSDTVQSVKPVNNHGDTTQSEFINILKQKSGSNANLPDPPLPSNRILTTISTEEFVAAEPVSCGTVDNHGEAISTIGVVGNSARPSSVKSDDMDLDPEEFSSDGNSDKIWQPKNDWTEITPKNDQAEKSTKNDLVGKSAKNDWVEKSAKKDWVEKPVKLDWAERPAKRDWAERPPKNNWNERPNERGPDFERRDFKGPSVRPRWPEQQRQWNPPLGQDRGGFNPRGGLLSRPRFQDNFRGPSPAKRPFFSPRQRMPYYRY